MEIERKFLLKENRLPFDGSQYPCHHIEQGYLCVAPVVRIRRDNDDYILTYKQKGMLAREEYNLPLTEEAYRHLRGKIDGSLIEKDRYVFPLENGLYAEVDCFKGKHEGLFLVEVEFPDLETAETFVPPDWCAEDVTYQYQYHNSYLSRL